VPELAEQQVFFLLLAAAVGDVLDREQERGAVVVEVEQLAGVEPHGAPAQAGDIVLDLVAFDRCALGDHRLEQMTQVGEVPLPVAELVQVAAESGVPVDAEDLEERAAGGHHAQFLVEDEQRLAHGVDDVLRLQVGDPQQAVEVLEVHGFPILTTTPILPPARWLPRGVWSLP
jgi:hypothetical protein